MNAFFTRLMGQLALLLMIVATPVAAQSVRSIDPNDAAVVSPDTPPDATTIPSADASAEVGLGFDSGTGPMDTAGATEPGVAAATPTNTYRKDDLIGAAEGVFGKGAKGLGELIEKILKDQGEPNAYIAGREAAAAIGIGLRYGSGTMSHSVEGQRPVYWTGPSLGFDLGADAAKTFVLVYNLYDSQDLYRRYPQVEGRAYFVGGFAATYLRRGNVALIPVRLGVGARAGVNVGYMKFSEKSRWLPF